MSERLPAEFLRLGDSSFARFLRAVQPDSIIRDVPASDEPVSVPHATTIVAATFDGGAVLAGDRRATMGNLIASRDMEKVFRADEFTAIGIAGVAGLGLDLVRLVQVELEHFEKIEGSRLSLDGIAHRLASMVQANLPRALQGLTAVPLLAGYDTTTGQGRIFSFDVVGGCHEEHDFYAVGSGSSFARSSLKKTWTHAMTQQAVIRASVQALADAAEDDSATGGPDIDRRIWPIVATVSSAGYQRVNDDELASIAGSIARARRRTTRERGGAS